MRTTTRRAIVYLASAFAIAAGAPVQGQTPAREPAQSKEQAPPPQANPASTAASPRLALPDVRSQVVLIQNVIIAANQANLTGEYAVLHGLAAPDFQKVNSPARLAEIFANLRSQRLDMSPLVLQLPKLTAAPVITERGMLRLTGLFETQPKQVHFDLLFQPIAGQWKMFGISLRTVEAQPTAPIPMTGAGASNRATPAQTNGDAAPKKK